jgi:predicted enzyme related to lactoylglutathione lyase
VERVTGIGGFFFRAEDPERLAAWYADHLGVDRVPQSYETPPWWQQRGPTVFAPMSSQPDALGGPDRQWSVNFRVTDLDAMVAQLRAAGIGVDVDPDAYPNGRFASLNDPEGNVVQLWQPTEAALREPT